LKLQQCYDLGVKRQGLQFEGGAGGQNDSGTQGKEMELVPGLEFGFGREKKGMHRISMHSELVPPAPLCSFVVHEL
jgi:hypothetical protein